MRDKKLYRHLLGLNPPWFVSKVELNVEEQRVDVWVDHKSGIKWPCPVCERPSSIYDHTNERVWRHLDSCQFKTYLHARPPRIECHEHGVLQVKLSWAEENARFTALFERLAIDVMHESTISGAMRILRISWDEAWHIMEKAVQRGLMRKDSTIIEYIGVDEKSIARGHTYMTLVSDIARGTVEYIAEDRKKTSLDGYFEKLTRDQLEGIRGIAMDMWDPYINSVHQHVPNGKEKIVFDRFHIMRHMNEAVDTVRKVEHKDLKKTGKRTLTGTKYLWLYAGGNLPNKHQERFENLKELNLKTGRAWSIKETLRELWDCLTLEAAKEHWKRWYSWAIRSRLRPIKRKAKMMKDRISNVLTYFKHFITNAMAEGLNSIIQKIKSLACGFRNIEHFKTAIYFHCGGLELYPTHTNP